MIGAPEEVRILLKKMYIDFRVFVDFAAGIVMISHFRRLPIRIRC